MRIFVGSGSTGHHEINNKIPEIRKPEHTDHHCSQQDMRNQQLFFPELFPARLHDHCFSHPHTSHPRIKKSHQKQHKHYIYHMGMEISQHKGITWKFMDRLVRHIRLEPWACRLGHRAGTPEPGGAGNLSCRRFAHCRALVVPEHGQPPRAVGSRRVSALR